MAAVQLVELNHRHMAIAEFLLANPSARLKEVAAAVGMSVSWVSIVCNSQIFREYLQQRNREVADSIHLSLQEKVAGIAHQAVEKLGEAIDNSQDPAFILAAADKTLQRLGYGAKGANVQINSQAPAPAAVANVDITILNSAREKVYALAGKSAPGVPSPAALPPSEQGDLGQDVALRPALLEAEEATWTEGAGGEVRAAGASAPGDDSTSTHPPKPVAPVPGNGG